MKFRFTVFLAIIFILGSLSAVSAQVDSAIAQVTNSTTDSFAGGISGDGRFIVFESYANIATENPRNADFNLEVFLFDYAQRRIFQITDTKNLLVNTANPPTTNTNIRVVVINTRPVISNDGKWLAFGSNATCKYPGNGTITPIEDGGNPGNFDPNVRGLLGINAAGTCNRGTNDAPVNNLPNDGNTEMWFYRIPDVAPANLSLGTEIPFTDLTGGTFVQATDTLPSRAATAGTSTTLPLIGDDNRNPSINDDGGYVSFMSNRNLEPCTLTPVPTDATCGNASPYNNNEIFLAVRTGTTAANVTRKQITATPRPTLQNPSDNDNPAISGNGLRIAFVSTSNNPIRGMTNGTNTDFTEEIFYADVDAAGNLGTRKVQVTNTVPTTPGTIVNVFSYGKRISRDGRYIAFDSYADLEATGSPIQTSFALYVYDAEDTTMNPTPNDLFDKVGPRSDADTQALGGDLRHFPSFTDYTGNVPTTLVLETRLNINSSGTIPATQSEGLNPNETRPAQVYSIPLNTVVNTTPAPVFTRLTKLPTPVLSLPFIQPLTTDSVKRMTFNLSRTEPGTGNFDFLTEVFYLLTPTVTRATSPACCSQFYTGATRLTVSQSPVPTPSPTATPTATPTPSPSATPIPTPTPQTPPAVQGISPGMLAIVDVTTGFLGSISPQTANGSLQRSFTLPVELSGVTMTINGAAVGLQKVSSREITFVVPPGTTPSNTPYEFVINNNGRLYKSSIVIVPTRPDVFSFNEVPGPGGRARIFNATNRVLTREPFNVTTFRFRGSRRVPTVVRLYMTGIQGAQAQNFNIRLGGVPIPAANISSAGAIIREPGVFSIDFILPPELDMDGDVPVVVTITAAGVTYTGRLDDTTSFVRIL